jgi:ferric-dicitrate binding protein FerR (iron transport regulator)
MAIFSKRSRRIHLKTVNPDVYTSWTTSKLIFDHTPLAVIKNRLENTFGIHVVICGDSLAQKPLSGSIRNESLSFIVSAVAKALHTTSTIKNHTVYIGHNCE